MDYSKFNFVVVGSGFFGSVIAERIANDRKENVLLIEKRDHTGGNCHSEIDQITGIEYHKYGTHIFHTSNQVVWNYIRNFTDFNGYFHQVLTTYKGKVYQMPINLETINSFFNINLKPFEVANFLKAEIEKEGIIKPQNFEEKAISLIGKRLYEAFIKGYTQKQWQKDPRKLPANILTRLPFRTNYNESYFHDKWQGIPEDGYAAIFDKILSSKRILLLLNTDFFDIKHRLNPSAKIIYSGPIDRYFKYDHGALEWRKIIFKNEIKMVEDYQGTSVMNYAEKEVPYTRIHEPKHLHSERNYPNGKTLVIKEFSEMDDGSNPYYPINDSKNHAILLKYHEEAKKIKNVFFSGRLGEYKYLDMHQTIAKALKLYKNKLSGGN